MKSNQRQLEAVQSELFEVTSKVSEKAEAKSDEVELLLNDLEACQQRASLAEKEVEALSEQIRVLQESGSRSVGQVFNGALYCKTNMASDEILFTYFQKLMSFFPHFLKTLLDIFYFPITDLGTKMPKHY